MRNRIPSIVLAIGLLIVSLTPRFVTGTDFVKGTIMGAGIGIELVGVLMMIRRGRTSSCRRAV